MKKLTKEKRKELERVEKVLLSCYGGMISNGPLSESNRKILRKIVRLHSNVSNKLNR